MSLFNARFYELIVHLPDEKDAFAGFTSTAKKYGYSGIGVLDLKKARYDPGGLTGDLSLHSAVGISGRSSKIRDEIKKYKDSPDILIVEGADEELARAAVEAEGIDILMQPVKFNNVLGKIASDNSVAIGFDAGSIIRLRGEARAGELRIMRTNLMYARKYCLRMVLTCMPSSPFDLRAPREMAALGGIFGMSAKEAVDAMSTFPIEILRTKSPDYIREGIEIV